MRDDPRLRPVVEALEPERRPDVAGAASVLLALAVSAPPVEGRVIDDTSLAFSVSGGAEVVCLVAAARGKMRMLLARLAETWMTENPELPSETVYGYAGLVRHRAVGGQMVQLSVDMQNTTRSQRFRIERGAGPPM